MKKFIKIFIIYIIYFYQLYAVEEWMYIYHPTLKDPYVLTKINDYKIFAITGFKIDQEGNIFQDIILKSYENILKNKIVYLLITLKNTKEGIQFLKNSSNYPKAIKNIINLIEPFSGVHIDFEYLSEKETLYFKDFLKELQNALKQSKKKLTVAIFPPIWEIKYNRFHNLTVLHPYIDEIVLMTYDYHNPKTKPGPVSELSWAEKNIQESLKYFKPHQIYLGIPLYGYEWEIKANKHRIVDYSYFKKILYSNAKKEVQTSFNFGTKIVYNNNQKVLFYPDSNFRKEMINMAHRYRLKGVAYWRLGFEK